MSSPEAGALAAIAAGTGMLAAGALGVFHPRVMLFGPGIWRGPSTERAVALTFDDGPHPEYTPRIASVLADHGARATFFCIGQALEREGAIARALHEAGHELANHTYRHGTSGDLFRPSRLTLELQRCEALLVGLTGKRSPYYRPAVGIRNPAVHAAARACGLQVVTWTDSARDGLFTFTPRRAERLAARARAGSILALHDGAFRARSGLREETVAQLPLLLRRLSERGLRFATLSELLAPS